MEDLSKATWPSPVQTTGLTIFEAEPYSAAEEEEEEESDIGMRKCQSTLGFDLATSRDLPQ